MKYKRSLFVLSLLILSLNAIHAQQTVLPSGSNSSGSGGSVSYSIGQVNYNINTSSNGSVAEGVQQPYEISVISAIKEYNKITLQCLAFPNPTKDILYLVIENYETNNLSYQLIDINGQLIKNNKIEAMNTSISMQDLVSSTYILKVMQGAIEINTFKIIKN
jgi:Secretion system C-terminal sorting domain